MRSMGCNVTIFTSYAVNVPVHILYRRKELIMLRKITPYMLSCEDPLTFGER